MTVTIGKPAPMIEVEVWRRDARIPSKFTPSDLRGQCVVLFFYPRDFSFLCPTEIAAFAALAGDFSQSGAKLVAASTDSFFSHQAFFTQDEKLRNFDFPVVADTSHALARAFGVLADDGSAMRGTFIIHPTRIVQ